MARIRAFNSRTITADRLRFAYVYLIYRRFTFSANLYISAMLRNMAVFLAAIVLRDSAVSIIDLDIV